MILDNWIGWLQVRIPSLKNGANVFWLKQAISGHAEYWKHRCLLAENVIKNSKVNVTSEMLDAVEMLDYYIDNQGLNCTPRIEAFLKQNVVNKNDFKSSVVGRSELYTCECKVCGKPFENNEDYYMHYDEEHN